jgi:hypothetical protein
MLERYYLEDVKIQLTSLEGDCTDIKCTDHQPTARILSHLKLDFQEPPPDIPWTVTKSMCVLIFLLPS